MQKKRNVKPYSKVVMPEREKSSVGKEETEDKVVKSNRCMICRKHVKDVHETLIQVAVKNDPWVVSVIKACDKCLVKVNLSKVKADLSIIKFPVSKVHKLDNLTWYQYHLLISKMFENVDWDKKDWKEGKSPFKEGAMDTLNVKEEVSVDFIDKKKE